MLAESTGKFLVGDDLTIADLAIYCEYRDVDYLGIFDVSEYENILRWVEACEQTVGLGEIHGPDSAFTTSALPGAQDIMQ